MRRLTRPLLCVLLCLSLAAFADQAKTLYEKGADAEARQNYEQAYDFYKQAYALKPKELRYRTSFERTRFLAASSHVHRGQICATGANWKMRWRSSRRHWRSMARRSSPSRN